MGKKILQIDNLSINAKGKEILTNASVSLSEGDIVILEGRNGTGKTTFIKSLIGLGKSYCKKTSGNVIWFEDSNTSKMSEDELIKLRSKIGYLDQRDNFELLRGVTVKDYMIDSLEAYLERNLKKDEEGIIDETFNKYCPKELNISLKTKLNRLSGGQQRLISIITSLCLRKDSRAFIIDEPLNNLDISMIVYISNLLNTIRIENPKSLFIVISHCKIFPFINKVLKMENKSLILSEEKIVCHSCFGEYNNEGFY
ncbi:MAG: ATP-binding cassette domain-containing protein [Lachnospiraceae bacterium]|nr:ATP-binding cassette domain-containing protein [Lachnospiraceae bacterium]